MRGRFAGSHRAWPAIITAVTIAGSAITGCHRPTSTDAHAHDRGLANRTATGDTLIQAKDSLQPAMLPPLTAGMTIAMISAGDSLYHGGGGCFVCHGVEAQGMREAGDALTVRLSSVAPRWAAIDSLVTMGVPAAKSRSPIAMPASGAKGNLTPDQLQQVAAYVWAISQTRGEPWPGGHRAHDKLTIVQAAAGTSNDVDSRIRRGNPGG